MAEETTIKVGPWAWTVHPTLPVPSQSWLVEQGQQRGPSWLHEFHAKREAQIQRETHDPLVYGWEQPPLGVMRALMAGTYRPGMGGGRPCAGANGWKQERPANDVLALGGNGSGKTECEAKLALECLVGRGGREVRCFSQNEQTSVRYIQKSMFRYLPPAYRKIKRQGQITKISYAEATGFSEGVFILPNHSAALFPTYKGWEQDKKSVEGGEADMATWDEEIPAELLETLRFRVHKKGGTVLGGFTPVHGYTETVAQYLEGAKVLESIPARRVVWDWWSRTWSWGEWLVDPKKQLVKGCEPGHVPYVLQSGQGNGRRFVVTFPTMFNPYTNVDAIIDSTRGKPLDFQLERLWGWPTKMARKAFPNFSDWHIVPEEKVPDPKTLSVYWFADPHGNRNWFMLWLGVDAENRVWVLREWPDAEVGEWAMPGQKPDGKMGPAQLAGSGKSFNDYKRLVYEIEGWVVGENGVWAPGPKAWTVVDRRIDPRPAGTAVPSDESARTYLDHLGDAIRSESGQVLVPGLDCTAAPHVGIEEGTQLINDWLTRGWDTNQEVTPLNCPQFYVSAGCENLIWALKTYSGSDGEKGACKDPVDCLKAAAKLAVRHLAAGSLGSYGGMGSY